MKIKIGRFIRDEGEFGPSDCLACPEELNGINFGLIWINKMKFRVSLCDDCLNKLRRQK